MGRRGGKRVRFEGSRVEIGGVAVAGPVGEATAAGKREEVSACPHGRVCPDSCRVCRKKRNVEE